MIDKDEYLMHASRYIHLNPRDYKSWQYSSLPYFLGKQTAEWLQPEKVLELFDNPKEYANFIADYEDYKRTLDEIKTYLADH